MKKKMFTLLLALVMIVSVAMPVFAADETTYTITINDSKTGHTYEAYQIFDGDISDGKLVHITWGTGIDGEAFLAALKADETVITNPADKNDSITIKNVFADCTTAESVAEVIKNWSNSGDRIQYFARKAANYLTDECYTADEGTDGTYTVSGVPAGYYLIKDAAYNAADDVLENDFYTDVILEVVKDATVDVKGDVPDSDKEVSLSATDGFTSAVSQEIGKKVYYRLQADLPSEYDEYTSYYYAFNDNMSKGLTYEGIVSISVDYSNDGSADLVMTTEDEEADTYPDIISKVVSDSGETSIVIGWNDLKTSLPSANASTKISVILEATVNKDAVIGVEGNPNDGWLEYSNDPNGDGHGTSIPDQPLVYTFEMDVIKTIAGGTGETASTLGGAKFVLMTQHVDDGVTTNYFAILNEDGKLQGWTTHYEGDECESHAEDEVLATVISSEAGELMEFVGLRTDRQYYLREVEAPAGYNKLFGDVPVKLSAGYDADGKINYFKYEANNVTHESGANTNNDLNVSVLVEVENKAGTTLPSTGGMGTTIFYSVGGLLVVAAVVLLITKKRMAAKN